MYPAYSTIEAGKFANQFCKIFYRYFKARPQIDRLGFIVFFCCQHNSLSSILHVEEFPGGFAASPCHDAPLTFIFSLEDLFNQGGNNMGGLGVEVVPRAIKIRAVQNLM